MKKGAAEAIGITSSAADVGITFDFVLRKDASAALRVVNWDGVRKDAPHKYGKPQHDRELEVQKVLSENTFAEMLTKKVKSEVLEKHMADMASIKPTRREIG